MLLQFIASHRDKLISRARDKALRRLAPVSSGEEVASGVPLFLDQLTNELLEIRRHPGEARPLDLVNRSAAMHGADVLAHGYSVARVVHDYCDISGAIAELTDDPIGSNESLPPLSSGLNRERH